MPACLRDFSKRIINPVPVIDVRGRNGGHADDSVHWGPYIVTHVRKKIRLCLISGLSHIICSPERGFLFPLLLHYVIDIPGSHHYNVFTAHSGDERYPGLDEDASLRGHYLICEGVVLIMSQQIAGRKLFQQLCTAFRREVLNILLKPRTPAVTH